MKTKRTSLFISFAFCACVGTEVAAQSLPVPLQECIAEKEDAKRLACFDRESARLAPQSTERPAATATGIAAAPVQAAKPRTDEENFGYRGKLAREEADRKATETHALEQLTATVVGIKARPHGEFVVTLSNGQEWAQKDGEKSMRLNLGDTVVIKPGALGAFFLSAGNSRATRVSRVK